MPKDSWGNIISEGEYDHNYRSDGEWHNTKDEFGNIVKRDENGNESNYDHKTGKNYITSSK